MSSAPASGAIPSIPSPDIDETAPLVNVATPTAWIFDLDDTLFAHREAVADGILATRTRLGGAIAAADAAAETARWAALEEHHYHRYLAGELDFEGQRRERARGFLEPFGIALDDAQASAWFDAYFVDYIAQWRLHADALPLLERLTAIPDVRLGIITNGDPAFQGRKLATVGLADRFETVVASGAEGVVKPDPTIFRIACERLGVEPASAVYVGDRLRTDAIGAADAGLTGIWIDRLGTASADELASASAVGVRVIRTLDELP